ncbi:hypothetical protein IL982_09440 [Photobacterium damselae subsp. damselae]|nr:hypothetical protein IL982_09440 [Photobacterium damselae subsp. damselae]
MKSITSDRLHILQRFAQTLHSQE